MESIKTELAPAAIGPYSQAVRAGSAVYISGQIPLDPSTMDIVDTDMEAQARQCFANIAAIADASGATIAQIVKINLSLVDMDDFSVVNAVMEDLFSEPYPARACVAVAALPRAARIEVEAILELG